MSDNEQLQYWRAQTARNHSPAAIERRVLEKAADREHALAGVIDRDPCGFCGVRADYGCRHNRRAA